MVLDSLSANIAVLDKTGTIIAVNEQWTRYVREDDDPPPKGTEMGANYLAASEGVTGEYAATAQAANAGIRAVMNGEMSQFSMEYPCHTPTEQRWFMLNVVPLIGHTGGTVVSHTDITENKLAEQALQRSQVHNRALLEAIPDAILHVRGDGTLLDVKAAVDAPMLYEPAEVVGQNQYDLQTPELARMFQERNRKVLELGTLQTLEFELQIADETRIRESRAVSIGKDEILVIVRDITERKWAEEELHISEARNRALLEAIPDAIAHIHRDGTVLDVKVPTDVSLLFWGTETIGKNQRDLLPSEVAHRLSLRNREALETGSLQTLDYEIELDGQTRIRESRAVPVGDDEVITIVRDITERKQQENALNRSEARNRALLEAIPDIIARIHKDGTVLDVTLPSNFQLKVPVVADDAIGKKSEDMMGHLRHNPIIASLIESGKRHLAEALKTGELREFVYDIEIGGETHTREIRMVPDSDDEVIAIIRNVTERNRQEEALRQSEARHRAILEAVPDAILRVHRDGTHLDVQAPVGFTSSLMTAQLVGKRTQDVLPADLARKALFYNHKALETGQPQAFEYDIEEADGWRTREARVVPSGEDEVTVIMRDVTERTRAQAEERRLLADVQTYSGQLRSLNQRLAESQETERRGLARELHDQVGQNLSTLGLNLNVAQSQVISEFPQAERVLTLLTDSQDLLKQATERVRNVMAELRPPMLDDFGLCATLSWYAERMARRAGFTVDVKAIEINPRLSEIVENALFRITQEAMTNITKHAQATHVRVSLQEENGIASLTITDDGHGFDLEELTKSAERESWGLLTMRERAEAVGGRFSIQSQNGFGTTITIEIDR